MSIDTVAIEERTKPQWIEKMYPGKVGRDHLGLGSVSSDQILPTLSPGINVLTIHPRYHSFYTFLLDQRGGGFDNRFAVRLYGVGGHDFLPVSNARKVCFFELPCIFKPISESSIHTDMG